MTSTGPAARAAQEAVHAAGAGAPSRHAPVERRIRSPWVDFALRRLGGLTLSVALLILVTFLVVPLIPGDPAVVIAGADATLAQIEAIRQELGLDDPLIVQFAHYVAKLFTFDLGQSFIYHSTVAEIIAVKLPYTARIALLAITIALVVAIPLGMAVGVLTRGGRQRWLDVAFGTGTGFIAAVPQYVMATFLIVIFAIGLRVLPAAGASSPLSMVLPTIALAIGPMCSIARIVRRETATVLELDYIRTARGWRLPNLRLYARYALPNLLTTTLTLTGIVLAAMLGGAIIIENVFNWPGLGKEIVAAILNKDYPVIRGIILTLGILATLINLAIDILLGLIDRRTLGAKHDS